MGLDASDRQWLTGLFADTNRRIDDVHKRVTDVEVGLAAEAAAPCKGVAAHEERYDHGRPCEDIQKHEDKFDHASQRGNDLASRGFTIVISVLAIVIAGVTLLLRLGSGG